MEKVVAFLKRLEDTKFAEGLVESGFKAITPDAIRMWVREGVKLLPDQVRRLYFENPKLAPHTRRALAKNWALVEHYLGDPENTFRKMVSANPENRAVLEEPRVRSYILEEIRKTYEYLARFVGVKLE